MAIVTKSIGTTGRDYSTMAAWEADLDDDTPYDAGDDAVGECYDDSVFNETVDINGGGTLGLNSVHLTAATGEEHDGTAGSGVRNINTSATWSSGIIKLSGSFGAKVTFIEVGSGNATYNFKGIEIVGGAVADFKVGNCIVQGMHTTSGTSDVFGIKANIRHVYDCFVYDITQTAGTNSNKLDGIVYLTGSGSGHFISNNTVFSVENTDNGMTSNVNGIRFNDDADLSVQNDAVCTVTTTGSGTASCFNPSSPSSSTVDHNLSSDTTAAGTGSLTSKTAANQFVSTTGGSEDLHLKTGADAIDAGTDLVTTPSGVEIDIDGRDRDANADTWDMGADEFVAVGGAANPKGPFGLPLHGPLAGPI